MATTFTLNEAIDFLKPFVKYSEVKNQKHIDLSLCLANDRIIGQNALVITRLAVEKGEITEDQLKTQLGLD